MEQKEVRIPVGDVQLDGTLDLPAEASAIIVFAHGSGSSRFSSRNRRVASALRDGGQLGTLLFDLLTADEERAEQRGAMRRFDVEWLAMRLRAAADWVRDRLHDAVNSLGYFGASTGAAAALIAEARDEHDDIRAVVARGGRPDLAAADLENVLAPTLLIVGSHDEPVIDLNREAFAKLKCEKRLEIVPGATHLFEEPGALERVAELAKAWFLRHNPEERGLHP
jgi:putative phosphoribosyl transferase